MAEGSKSSNIPAPVLEGIMEQIRRESVNFRAGPNDIGDICRKKTLYEGPPKCTCCINWVEQYPEDTKESAEETLDTKHHAIVCRIRKAHGDSKKPLQLHSIIVQSPLLKSVLGGVFSGYPGVTTTLEELKFQAPFWEFFYRWQALEEVLGRLESDKLEHTSLLVDTLTDQLGDVHRVAKDQAKNNVITYDFLWSLFPPGSLVYTRLHDQDCLLEVQRTKYYEGSVETYYLHCMQTNWDGERFGWESKTIEIPKFSGTQSIQDLNIYPVAHHKTPEEIKSRLLERGNKFVSLGGRYHKAYCGIIHASNQGPSGKFHINERVVVDAEAFSDHVESSSYLHSYEKEVGLSEQHRMICTPVVKAYGLKTKCWGRVYVDDITDIQWDQDAFDHLVLKDETKELVKSLVSAQIKETSSLAFDDVVKGKGQGMILLLTGEPGVGKTLTAETVAEKARRPLYAVSAGELGISSHDVEEGLTKIFDLAYKWDAVLLLDECDVFLEERTSDNLQRNQLVSVFLRMLEYFRGILFLTTNRVSVFDVAFQSRIHLTLHYNGLDYASRKKIWEVLLKLAQADSSLSKADLDIISQEPLNGRQIKNAVKAAKSLAIAKNVPLEISHINTVLRVMHGEQNQGNHQGLEHDSSQSKKRKISEETKPNGKNL
ncbi:P-loop containing nucleoside triphosphate hydrolase protein [Annulohypoxylon moriforme]|nr:P-loop containing nucleoside triphosphate hydrolase protein [Annulohypoxylon moriforme]